MNLFHNTGRKLLRLAVGSAVCVSKVLAKLLLTVMTVISVIASELLELLLLGASLLKWLGREFSESFRNRVKISDSLMKELRQAKKEGGTAYKDAKARFIVSFFFGEDGFCYTAFNYLLPLVCITFLIGIISYGSGLEYGLAVECNGKQIGIISAEADFEKAKQDAHQRIAFSGDREAIDMSARYSLKMVSDSDSILTASQLADKMLASSDEELIEAYGIYIDGDFIGAVRNTNNVAEALDKNLLDYKVDGIIRDLSYVSKIEYTQGIYLKSSLMKQQEAIDMLTSTKKQKHIYFAQEGDNILSIVQKYGMQLEEFEEMNPSAATDIVPGQMYHVVKTERYLPVKYIREVEAHSFISYETVEVETSSLNVGVRSILTKGERGEKLSKIEITYVDNIESARKVLSSSVLKNPVVEIVGIGTYSATPDDPERAYFGSPLTGTGQMGWPVNGGYVSDSFISDRNHKGMDIAAPEGTEIYAAEEGWVVSSGWNSGGYGNVVMIEHPDGYATVYAHMIMTAVSEGQYVIKGQLIGYVGNTGNSFGNHCHFEVRHQGICLDPASFLNTVGLKKKEKE